MARKPTDEVQLKLRFNERLRHRLERAASQNARSMNAEIVERLAQSFRQEAQKKLIQAVATASATAAVEKTINIVGLPPTSDQKKGEQ